jgi:TetR/AcrR family transcriptional repressor of uid operon|uniref:TetR/AcrR family transcriptional regulator n=1 Tax=uncultured Sphingomonas sp. TaxID=158754 RepID=UPI0035C9AB40
MFAVQHKKNSRSGILSAARMLFSTKGFHQTAMSELATAAGVSVGQIYRLFAGKSDVIRAIVEEDATARIAEISALGERLRSGAIDLRASFLELAEQSLKKGDEALSFEILAEAHRNPDVARAIADLCTRYRAVLREFTCAANPTLSEAKLDGAEEVLLAIMFGLGHRTLSRPRLSVEQTAQSTADLLIAAFLN